MRAGRLLRTAAALALVLTLLFCLPLPAAHAVCVREFLDPGENEEAEPLTPEEREENIRLITAYLRDEMELPDSAVAAILANMDRESGFDPRAVDSGRHFFGLCQWSKSRWLDCFYFCQEQELDRLTVEGQLAFLRHELETDYEWIALYYLIPAEISEDGAQEAQYYFCQYFEAPLELEWEQVIRSKLVAEVYWPRMTEESLAGCDVLEELPAAEDGEPLPDMTKPAANPPAA